MNYYLDVLNKYAEFNGRSSRKEYWMFFLFNLVITGLLVVIDVMISNDNGILTSLYTLAVFIPSLALSIRRIHDAGISALWLLLAFIPIIGPIAYLIFMILDSQPGNNQYGPMPRGK